MRAQLSLKKRLWRYRFVILALSLILAGVLLDVFHAGLPLPELARDVGIALLIAGTVALGLELYTRKEFLDIVAETTDQVLEASTVAQRVNEIKQIVTGGLDLRALGVKRLDSERFGIDFAELLGEAAPGSEIKVLGICLMSLTDSRIQHILGDKLRAGCRIKILLLDPESRAVEERAADEGREYQEVRHEIEHCEGIHQLFVKRMRPRGLPGQLALGYYDRYPGFFLIAVHSRMVIGFYLRGHRGEDCPHMELEVKGGGLCQPFLSHFDAAWDASKVVIGETLPFNAA